MPVQINEMIIRATISEPASNPDVRDEGNSGSNLDKDELIKECADLVMEMLNKKSER